MLKLTDRQTAVLKAIVEEYIETAEPVGSDTLDKKYHLGVSPATIRNEMVKLAEKGLLKQTYISSGRIPTTTALKFYIHRLMEEKQLGVTEEVAVKEKIWDHRHKQDDLLREITKILAEKTNSLALAVTDEEELYHSGYANVLDMPEFFDIDITKSVLSVIEDIDQLNRFFAQAEGEEIIHALMGDDFDFEPLSPCSLIFINFDIKDKVKGSLGVIGPCRLNYSQIVPTLKYFGNLIEEVLTSK